MAYTCNCKPVLRTLLFTAGHNQKYIEKAFSTSADSIVLDLEDAVPVNKKQEAREMIYKVLNSELIDKRPVYVRVNPIESGFTLTDVNNVACNNLDGFVYPKAYNEDDIKAFSAQLTLKEKELVLPENHFSLIVLIETPESVINAVQIARASKRVIALLFGCEDFLTELEGSHGVDGRSLMVPRHLISMAARAAHIIPIDTPYVQVGDSDGLRRHIQQAKELGYEGMLIMSPSQFGIAQDMYTPTTDEVEKAKEMIEFADESAKTDRGISMKGATFVSPPTLLRAHKLIKRFNHIQLFEEYIKSL